MNSRVSCWRYLLITGTRLAKILAGSIDDFTDGRIADSWNSVVAERIAETEFGESEEIDSSDVHEKPAKSLCTLAVNWLK